MKQNETDFGIVALMYTAFIIMILVNGLANIIPYNETTSTEIYNLHFVMFMPAIYVFSIWTIICIGIVVWLIGVSFKKEPFMKSTALLFIISCLLNSLWIFLWHYQFISGTLLIKTLLLLTLLILYLTLPKKTQSPFSIVFSIYLAWVTVTFLANLSYYLVAVMQISNTSQMIISINFLFLGLGIGAIMLYLYRNYVFNLVLIWAYIGIFIHDYLINPIVSIFALILATIILGLIGLSLFKKIKTKKPASSKK